MHPKSKRGNVIIFGNEYTAAAWPPPCIVPIVVIVAFPRVIVPDKCIQPGSPPFCGLRGFLFLNDYIFAFSFMGPGQRSDESLSFLLLRLRVGENGNKVIGKKRKDSYMLCVHTRSTYHV